MRAGSAKARRIRRNLVDLLADDLDLTELVSHHPSPAEEVVRRDLHAAPDVAIESVNLPTSMEPTWFPKPWYVAPLS